jgi:putative membrane protein
MKILIFIAKLAIAFVWIILGINIFSPFHGATALMLYVLTVFLFLMHGLQMMIFLGAFGDKLSLTKWERFSILIFGIFALLGIRQKHMQ